ncbi:MAG: phage shock protein operon transcriptional activator [Alphaproteobacteria bacterium]|nr:phage shock protein operon transcriptional activator [Alphaproteobacteria bacterium]
MRDSSSLPAMLGQSAAFTTVLAEVRRLAAIDRPVLVIGERGTGKELVAARLHYLSQRWAQPLVTLNCGAIAESLLEAELFGYEAGAFTGAQRRRQGRFEAADGGTLFLDEIANASMAVQERLLRAVEYGQFERVGGTESVRVDVRVVAATNVDLPALSAAGRFRADLLDRLAFEVVTLPPLRARREDIPILADAFARAMASELGWSAFPGFTEGAIAALLADPWPGNIRALKSCVERSLARHGDPQRPVAQVVVDPFASPWRPRSQDSAVVSPAATAPVASTAAATPAAPIRDQRAQLEREAVARALAQAGGHGPTAAAALGLGYHQFRRLVARYGLVKRRGSPNRQSE